MWFFTLTSGDGVSARVEIYKMISNPAVDISLSSSFIDMADKDAAVMHLEDQPGQGICADDAEFLSNFSYEARKTVLRKASSMTHDIINRLTDRVRVD